MRARLISCRRHCAPSISLRVDGTDTHYDGQITWDPYCAPTSQNGVTTVVFGNWYVNRSAAQNHSVVCSSS